MKTRKGFNGSPYKISDHVKMIRSLTYIAHSRALFVLTNVLTFLNSRLRGRFAYDLLSVEANSPFALESVATIKDATKSPSEGSGYV